MSDVTPGSGTKPSNVLNGVDTTDPKQAQALLLLNGAVNSGRIDAATAQQYLNASTTNGALDASRLGQDIYGAYLKQTQALYAGQDEYQRNQTFTNTYAQIFTDDPSATWFGLATIASAQVGQGLDLTSAIDRALATALLTPTDNIGGTLWDEGPSNELSVIHQGLAAGNKAVFDSQYSAYQVFQDSGVNGIQAIVSSGVFGDARAASTGNLIQGYQALTAAHTALASGNQTLANQFAGQSLYNLANFEQRTVLQPIYDTKFSAGSETISFRDAIDAGIGLGRALPVGPDLSSVNIDNRTVPFMGTDLGDPTQRMTFVNQVANTFMSVYNSPNGIGKLQSFAQHLTNR